MLATDKIVCHLGGGADRHKSQHCQPRGAVAEPVVPKADASSAIAEHTPGEGEAAGAGAATGAQAGGDT